MSLTESRVACSDGLVAGVEAAAVSEAGERAGDEAAGVGETHTAEHLIALAKVLIDADIETICIQALDRR